MPSCAINTDGVYCNKPYMAAYYYKMCLFGVKSKLI